MKRSLFVGAILASTVLLGTTAMASTPGSTPASEPAAAPPAGPVPDCIPPSDITTPGPEPPEPTGAGSQPAPTTSAPATLTPVTPNSVPRASAPPTTAPPPSAVPTPGPTTEPPTSTTAGSTGVAAPAAAFAAKPEPTATPTTPPTEPDPDGPICPPPGEPGEPGQSAGYATSAAAMLGWGEPNRVDEFDGQLGPDWGVYDGPGHAGNGTRTPDAVSFDNGVMTITGDSEGNTAGMAWNPGQRYGRWEGRVRAPASDETYNALLLLWPDAEDFPEGGEIDFMEMMDPTRQLTNIFLHYGENNDQVEGEVEIDGTEWHNWAVEWTPTHVAAFVDGEEWWRTDDADILPPRAMHLCIQLDWFPDEGSGDVQESYMHVDWVKSYPLDEAGDPGDADGGENGTDDGGDDGRDDGVDDGTDDGVDDGTDDGGDDGRDDGGDDGRDDGVDDGRDDDGAGNDAGNGDGRDNSGLGDVGDVTGDALERTDDALRDVEETVDRAGDLARDTVGGVLERLRPLAEGGPDQAPARRGLVEGAVRSGG